MGFTVTTRERRMTAMSAQTERGWDIVSEDPDAVVVPLIEGGEPEMISDRELYADATKTRLLEAGDDAAAFLVVSQGGKRIPGELVRSLGLVLDGKGRVVQKGAKPDKPSRPPEPPKEREAGKDKELPAPKKTKGAAKKK